MTEPVYEPFDEDRVRLILLEEVYYLTRAADGELKDAVKEEGRPLAAAVVAALGKAAKERISTIRARRRAG